MNLATACRQHGGNSRRRSDRSVDWSLTAARDRALDLVIASCVEEGSSVLDLGCGHGELLSLLKSRKKVREAGIELDADAATEAISRGLSVVHSSLEEGLNHLADGSFDLVILNQVITIIRDPLAVLRESFRVGRQVAVTVPNFAVWRNRIQVGFGGRMPVTGNLPYQWHETPNIRWVTVRDFRRTCCEQGYRIIREGFVRLSDNGTCRSVQWWPNMRASSALFLLQRGW